MRIFRNAQFSSWADDMGLQDKALLVAVDEMRQGLVDARLGGSVYKKRIRMTGRGKRGGARMLLAFAKDDRVIMYGFAKNQRENINPRELQALKKLAAIYLGWDDRQLQKALKFGDLKEVVGDE